MSRRLRFKSVPKTPNYVVLVGGNLDVVEYFDNFVKKYANGSRKVAHKMREGGFVRVLYLTGYQEIVQKGGYLVVQTKHYKIERDRVSLPKNLLEFHEQQSRK